MKVLTQKEMCDLSGVDRATMSRYCRGKKIPSIRTAKRISLACKVPMDIFLDRNIQEKYLGKSYLKENINCEVGSECRM